MKKIVLIFSLFIYSISLIAQDEFRFKKETNKVKIPFKLINNLIFIPVNVNGVELTFLLDSGVGETVLFSLEERKDIDFKNVEKISLRGLGSEEAIEGLKSTGNVLDVKGIESVKHLLYIILDQNFNLSSHIGIPVNGIIGYNFFKNNLIEINYGRRRITIYRDNEKNRKRIEKKYNKVAISIEKSKPYVFTTAVIDTIKVTTKVLIDIGNSDAVWLFEESSKNIRIPNKNFEDYLGKGFSGDIEGKRARISKFTISKYEFNNPIVAFPDSLSIKNVRMVEGRMGSIGGEILRRFSLVFDYPNELMYLKKNNNYRSPFTYNKSGIEVRHIGMQWVQETVHLETIPVKVDDFSFGADKSKNDFKYKFQLKPVYEIANIRKESPAATCGLLAGDIIVTINKSPVYKYSLEKINSLLKSDEEKWYTIEVRRDNMLLKFTFQLKDVL